MNDTSVFQSHDTIEIEKVYRLERWKIEQLKLEHRIKNKKIIKLEQQIQKIKDRHESAIYVLKNFKELPDKEEYLTPKDWRFRALSFCNAVGIPDRISHPSDEPNISTDDDQ
jgi:hypothetical protein